jgi:colicin import membrane protein
MSGIDQNAPDAHLEDQDILEISPVRRPANRRPKIFQKSGDDAMTLTPEQKEILAPYAKAADISEDDLFKALSKMDEDKRDDLFKALSKMADEKKAAETKAAEDKEAAEQAKTADAARQVKLEKALELVADNKAEEALPLLNELAGKSELFKSEDLSPAAKKAFEKMEADAKADRKRLEKAEAEIEEGKVAERKRVWTEKAEKFKAVPGKDKGALLADIAELDEDLAGKVHEFMKAADSALAEAGLYDEIGNNREGGEGSAMAEAETLAKKYQAKSAEPMTEAQAFTQVIRDNPGLRDRINAENNA